MKRKILELAKTNKGHNMLCDIKDAYIEVLKYHIRRNEGTQFKFRTANCAEADAELVKAIAKFIAKVEGIPCNLNSLTAGISDIEFGVNNFDSDYDSVLGCHYHNKLGYQAIRIRSPFCKTKKLYTTLLHEIIHFSQAKLRGYEFDYETEYRERHQEIQAYTISELVMDMF